jgi:mono/diheme cytochrome c family protein
MMKSTERSASSRFRTLAVVTVAVFMVHPGVAQDQTAQGQTSPGQETFQTVCVACHTIGGGRLIGPDLEGIEERRSEEWIIRFVQGSQAMVNAGDPVAVALFAEYNSIPMPDNALTDDEVRSVLDYIRTAAAAGEGSPAQSGSTTVAPATPDQILLGQQLFQGTTRFANAGPTCNSCHEVTNDAVIGGGVLARELTTVFTRLGGPGVRAILGSPPFPVMQRAYEDRSLTDEEVVALVGFLQQADAEQALHQPRDYGIKLFTAGIIGAAVLLGLYTLMWSGRKRGSVNQAIYDRQVTST